jgi:hypothetical protein
MVGLKTDLDRLATELVPLEAAALRLLMSRSPGPIETYLNLLDEARTLDVASPAGAAFQRRFNGFYGVRRNAAWRVYFYEQFQLAKAIDADVGVVFAKVPEAMRVETGRVEASFTSKLVATLHPSAPIIDSVVRGFLAARVPAPPFGGAIETVVPYYAWLREVTTALGSTRAGKAWVKKFDGAFGHVLGAPGIEPVKKIDFLIWGGARG